MSDTEYWQLKKLIKAEPAEVQGIWQDDTDGMKVFSGAKSSLLKKELFDELFEPVDIETKRQAIEKAIAEAVRKTMPYNATTYQEYSIGVTKAVQNAVDAVLGVVGLTETEKETK